MVLQAGVVIELEVDDSSTSNAAGQELVSLLTFSESNVIDSMVRIHSAVCTTRSATPQKNYDCVHRV